MAPTTLDLDSVLAALVLAPATYSRNRFFELYKDPALYRVRRRATLLRSVIRHLSPRQSHVAEVSDIEANDGRIRIRYGVPTLGLRRTVSFDPLELSLVRFAVSRDPQNPPPELLLATPEDKSRIEDALSRLSPHLTAGPIE